jgi:surface carbohydrate biosynthesis protein
MNNKIAIPIETKVREFDGKLWLSLNFVSRGDQVIIGPPTEIKKTLDYSQPDVYITKDPGDGNEDFFDELRSAGISVCGLDTEGAVYESIEKFAYNKRNFVNHIDALLLGVKNKRIKSDNITVIKQIST